MGEQTAVSLKGIKKGFSGVPILKGVDLTLKQGEVLALMGENGAGKSTLVNILMGIYQRDAGEITIGEKKFESYNVDTAREQGITMIPQELALVPSLTVAENIFLSSRRKKSRLVSWNDMFREAETIIEELGFQIDARARIDSLPISHRQQVAIIKVLAENAKVIIMDEPTSSLSREEVVRLQSIIRELKGRGVSVIYISHFLDEVFEVADTITVLRDGYFIASKPRAETTQKEVVSLMVGEGLFKTQQILRKEIENEEENSQETVMEVRELIRGPGCGPVSFRVKKGEVLGITGLVGAGKSELMRSLCGVDKFESGEILVSGEQVNIRNIRDAYNCGISVVPEDRKLQGLVLMRSVLENMTLAVSYRKQISRRGFSNRRREYKDAAEYVEKLGIKIASLEQKAGRLSGGNQQKCVISKALLTKPKLLFLDEPTRGIDVGAKTVIYSLIRKLKAQGMSIVLFSSDIGEIPIVCDRVIVLSNNSIAGELSGKEAAMESILAFTVGGTEHEA